VSVRCNCRSSATNLRDCQMTGKIVGQGQTVMEQRNNEHERSCDELSVSNSEYPVQL